MSWTRLTLQVRTPLFSGDDPAWGSGSPVRTPSIRGALRFWYRTVAAGHGVSSLTTLWQAEEAVFGSTRTPSAIGLRVVDPPTARGRGSKPGWATSEKHAHGFDGAQYLLGQGLWDHRNGLRRGYVDPLAQFALDIRFGQDEKINAQFMLALWAWLTYGGLGARVRRGFGQLVCTAVHTELPCGWTQADLSPPSTADEWRAQGDHVFLSALPGQAALGWNEPWTRPIPEGEPLPELPTLAPRWWAGSVLDESANSLGEALHRAGVRWRQFRAADNDDRDTKPHQSTRSPEWLNVIHGNDHRYPIAAFGLPVSYFSQSGGKRFKATVTPTINDKHLRRASPVWLRPVLVGSSTWYVFTHVFFARLLPPDATLTLKIIDETTRTLPLPSEEDIEDAWNRWIEGEPRLPHSYYAQES